MQREIQMSEAYTLNQFAPQYLAGVNTPPAEAGFEDQYFDYVYNPANGPNVLAMGTEVTELLDIDPDADFYITGWYLSKVSFNFLVQLSHSSGYEITDGFVNAYAISFEVSNPSPLSPAFPCPAGSQLQITLRELGFADVDLQIVFKGFKRFRRERRA